MKNGKSLTNKQRKYISSLNLMAENWLIAKCTSKEWLLVHKWTGQAKIIPAP